MSAYRAGLSSAVVQRRDGFHPDGSAHAVSGSHNEPHQRRHSHRCQGLVRPPAVITSVSPTTLSAAIARPIHQQYTGMPCLYHSSKPCVDW